MENPEISLTLTDFVYSVISGTYEAFCSHREAAYMSRFQQNHTISVYSVTVCRGVLHTP
jgi:hypothetical protein